ncbi:type III secretion system cytoplasmic ring protein SctQ [Acidovorax sp. SUPP3334]|uniref:type III secretion system cytoplasmic ring protein SctQ n=1 Tax=Acidovorax sp. SUPP3334 TaxID=2920881 RepID=UPI0023DE4961|nr:type III secretion system cytoplasmic ring protein SctQ [Acidovorax sp. SUPP3334]GKT20945.1 type III secretion system cytoplasmic ring protein SctQ [Acidovorax sp. SUPP3334]
MAFQCAQGSLSLCVPTADWPALEMAARLPEAALARDVAQSLMVKTLAPFQAGLPGLVLHGMDLGKGSAPFEVVARNRRVGLQAMDEAMAGQIQALLSASIPASANHLFALRVACRIRLVRKAFRSADLQSIGSGDVLLTGLSAAASASLHCHLSFGMGASMETTAQLDIDSHQATLDAAPQAGSAPIPESALPEDSDIGTVGQLSIPVAFEIDSARVRLDDLAAFGPGSVITLDTPVRDATVRLVCHDQVVGIGRLIVIGEQLGVRIERMGIGQTPDATQALP